MRIRRNPSTIKTASTSNILTPSGGTLVISKPEDRPKFAYQKYGHAWISWNRRGDTTGRDGITTLALRNIIKLNGFNHSLFDVCAPGTEATVMGEYLPKGRYFPDADAFDREIGKLIK